MDFPRLDSADIIGIDIETKDEELRDRGNGVMRDDTFIAGLAVATRDAHFYFPIAHENDPANIPLEHVRNWANDQLSTPIPKCGANIQYDLSYLWHYGFDIAGPFYDIQIAEPLIDETQFSYSLENIANKYLGTGKVEEAMMNYIHERFHPSKKGTEKSYIWKCPSEIVAPYAGPDAQLPIFTLDHQLKELESQGLMEVWALECELLPILTRMHLNGCRVDLAAAEQLHTEWGHKIAELEEQSQGINARSSKQIAVELDRLGVKYPRHPPTPKMLEKGIMVGNPKLDSDTLEELAEQVPFLEVLVKLKAFRHYHSTFVNGYILNSHVNGRVHATFNQLKGDGTGTVTGRLSCAHPNLLNIPNPENDPYFSAACRKLFLPDDGMSWLRFDLSQFEYREIVHFASLLPGSGADFAVQMYHDSPDTDFHQMCADMMGIKRKPAKSINFGISFGMGKDKLTKSLGVDPEEGKRLLALYHEKVPFVKVLSDHCSAQAQALGYMTTLSGRRRRFPFWEPKRFGHGQPPIKDEALARATWKDVKRAHTHKGLNTITQGGNADWIKKAMVEGVKAGVTDTLGMYLNSIYDELGFNISPGDPRQEEAASEMKHIFSSAYKLNVPVLVSEGRGANWSEAS